MTRALVTGAGSEIGTAIALYLAEAGFDVALHSVAHQDIAAEVCARIVAQGGRAQLLNGEDVQSLVDDAQQLLGGLVTCLVNGCAMEQGSLSDIRADASNDGVIPFQTHSLALVQAMAQQNLDVYSDAAGEPTATGVIVTLIPLTSPDGNTSSMEAKLAERGLIEMTRIAAAELAPAVRINAIGFGAALQGGRKTARDLSRNGPGRGRSQRDLQSDVLATIEYLINAPVVTGQLFCLETGPA
ncbi:MAG: SDR family oxidoreductase [Roseobacter sp.]